MGKIINATLKKAESWYNPLFIYEGNVPIKEIQNFVFFNPSTGDKIGQTGRGWFDSKNIAPLDLNIERKMKTDLTLNRPFYMVEKKPYEDVTGAVIYIPAEVVKTEDKTGVSYEKGQIPIFTHTSVCFKDAHGETKEVTLIQFKKNMYSDKWEGREKVIDLIKEKRETSSIPSRDAVLAVAKAMKELGLTPEDLIE